MPTDVFRLLVELQKCRMQKSTCRRHAGLSTKVNKNINQGYSQDHAGLDIVSGLGFLVGNLALPDFRHACR